MIITNNDNNNDNETLNSLCIEYGFVQWSGLTILYFYLNYFCSPAVVHASWGHFMYGGFIIFRIRKHNYEVSMISSASKL